MLWHDARTQQSQWSYAIAYWLRLQPHTTRLGKPPREGGWDQHFSPGAESEEERSTDSEDPNVVAAGFWKDEHPRTRRPHAQTKAGPTAAADTWWTATGQAELKFGCGQFQSWRLGSSDSSTKETQAADTFERRANTTPMERKKEEWEKFRQVFIAWSSTVHAEHPSPLEKYGATKDPMDLWMMLCLPMRRKLSKAASSSSIAPGRPCVVGQGLPNSNGFEMWRRLVQLMEPARRIEKSSAPFVQYGHVAADCWWKIGSVEGTEAEALSAEGTGGSNTVGSIGPRLFLDKSMSSSSSAQVAAIKTIDDYP